MNKSKKEFPADRVSFAIEDLGPIRDSIVNFKPFLLFSGESNTGKSYTAMAVYYFFFMLNNEQLVSELTSKLFDIRKIENDLKFHKEIMVNISKIALEEVEKLYNKNIHRFMAYMLGYDEFSCKVTIKLEIPEGTELKTYFSISKSKEQTQTIKLKTVFPTSTYIQEFDRDLLFAEPANELKKFVKELYMMLFFDKPVIRNFLLPPARGAFSGLTPSMLKEFSGIGMYNEFLEGIDNVRFRGFLPEAFRKQEEIVNSLFSRLLNGNLKVEKNRISFRIPASDGEIPLTAGSSSVKELFPLYIILNRLPIDNLSICIEEPEAHLHPELQRSAALLLAYIVNNDGFIQVTTHSDFFVNQVNNLLKLHFIKNKEPNRFKKILKEVGIREEFVLDPKDMGNYYFEKVKDVVHVRELEASENGMPLESFKHTYDQSVKETRNLREALTDDEK
jgi:predicted ATPase